MSIHSDLMQALEAWINDVDDVVLMAEVVLQHSLCKNREPTALANSGIKETKEALESVIAELEYYQSDDVLVLEVVDKKIDNRCDWVVIEGEVIKFKDKNYRLPGGDT